ncbi:MAG TPA: hypothetical protein DDX93_00405, partial [Smithella sp.]|nr:hypothetical protein [Smithella sp.]
KIALKDWQMLSSSSTTRIVSFISTLPPINYFYITGMNPKARFVVHTLRHASNPASLRSWDSSPYASSFTPFAFSLAH